jgi:hypothetical protein
METQVRTPQMVFMQPQRLAVPLFQRPYVWNEESQWEPLWNDVTRVAERVLAQPSSRQSPHFLGAVVLQQLHRNTGQMQERTIIDGQQRLTTLQLLFDALHAELLSIDASQPALRLEPLIKNAEAFWSKPEDQFKVWPTNRDRPGFIAVMGAKPPVNYSALAQSSERMVQAHRYFAEQARSWLSREGSEKTVVRAVAIETAVRDLLQVVVIDLGADENAQEIFETLNARGAQLTAADLIKNFIFQRLLEKGTDVEKAYESYWKEFESGFWETEISVGRLRYPRSAIFLNHWLIANTGEEILAREVFERFKRFATDATVPMNLLLKEIHAAAGIYRRFISEAATAGSLNNVGLFGYRTGVLESEVIKPLVLCLLDPTAETISSTQLSKALNVIESWMVRRMLVRATTKNYNAVIAELISKIREHGRSSAGDIVEGYLAEQSSASRYWPDDEELKQELTNLLAYRRIGRGRLRMVLEAIEDHMRGWLDGTPGLGGERVARGRFAIEHVMPRKWQANWPLPKTETEEERDRLIHTLGNLTLLTTKINTKASNGPWVGKKGKKETLEGHDVFFLNRDLLKRSEKGWTQESIKERTKDLASLVIKIWPVPENHKSAYRSDHPQKKKVDLSDLIAAGLLTAGIPLFPRRGKYNHKVATLLADGQVEVDGVNYASPSDAARAIVGKSTNGWSFFLTDQASRRSLRKVRIDYINAMAVDAEDDDGSDEDDSEDDMLNEAQPQLV